MVSSSSLRRPGLASAKKAPWRHAVGDVAESLRPHLVEIFEHTRFQQFRMQGRDTVDRVTAHGGQVRHPHAFVAVLTDQRHPAHPVVVAGETCTHLVEEEFIDLKNDLKVPRQRLAEHRQRPGFQRLWQQGVVGVAEGGHRDFPRLVPIHSCARRPVAASARRRRSTDACR
jgi:hypothetical protein